MGFFFFPFLIKVTFRYHKVFCNYLTLSVPGGPDSHTTFVSRGTSLAQVSLELGKFRSGFSPGELHLLYKISSSFMCSQRV